MPLCRYRENETDRPHLGLIVEDQVIPVAAAGGPATLTHALQLSRADLRDQLTNLASTATGARPLEGVTLLAPIDQQEVWAAGVTYKRSRDARMEESTQEDIYDLVYDAERPELFLKATPNRVVDPECAIAVRGDSTWDVPEPELALMINTSREIVGYTVGNDVSSRSIEGENPLYLPQAKVFSACAALGPVVVLDWELPTPEAVSITLRIERVGATHFEGTTSTAEMHRPFAELVDYLHRYNAFANGVILMTGTGIIPPSEFTLEDGDVVSITIDGIGTLRNPVKRL